MSKKVNVLPPHDPWSASSITDDDLQALVDAGMLCLHLHGS
jgi:hypothetical protein